MLNSFYLGDHLRISSIEQVATELAYQQNKQYHEKVQLDSFRFSSQTCRDESRFKLCYVVFKVQG